VEKRYEKYTRNKWTSSQKGKEGNKVREGKSGGGGKGGGGEKVEGAKNGRGRKRGGGEKGEGCTRRITGCTHETSVENPEISSKRA
jgi:hypothetical protein